MDIPKDYTPEEYANAFFSQLKPLLQELIRQELNGLPVEVNGVKSKEKGKNMTALGPQCQDTGRYSLSETCKILSLSIKTVLKYTESGDLKHGIHKHNGRKFYKGLEIKKFWKSSY